MSREGTHVDVANRIMGWSINADGGTTVPKRAINRVDRMVCALMRIRDGAERGDFSPSEVARMAAEALCDHD